MLIRNKIATAVATSALLLNALTPAFAATTIEVSGNGSFATNGVSVSNNQNTTVTQANTATVTNAVTSTAKTGGNSANDNTNGDVVVKTGNAVNTTAVSTQANSNQATVNNCNCAGGTDVLVSGNGSYSHNSVGIGQNSTTTLFQNNNANVVNAVNATSNTGGNNASRNTGGDVTVMTGGAASVVGVSNKLNQNMAQVGGNAGSSAGAGLTVREVGNGSFSTNTVGLTVNPVTTITQANLASVINAVGADAITGNNTANDNTNGDVFVGTGNAVNRVGVDTMANFNAASTDCGCLLNTLVKIADNGSFSNNGIAAVLGGTTGIFQGQGAGNAAFVLNPVNANANTGGNDANRNTGATNAISDPSVMTGSVDSLTTVSTKLNENIVGPVTSVNLPGNVNLTLSMSLAQLLGVLGLQVL